MGSWSSSSPRPRRAACAGTTWRRRCCSSRTRPTPPRAAEAPRRRSTRCARSSATTPNASSSPIRRATRAIPWASGSRTSWPSGRWRPASFRPCRTSATPTLSSGTSTCRTVGSTRCATRCAWRRASARRSACCCCAGRRWPTAGGATPRSSASPTGSPTPRPGRRGCASVSGYEEPKLEVVQHRLRVADQGGGPACAGARSRAARRAVEAAGGARAPLRRAPAAGPAGGARACRCRSALPLPWLLLLRSRPGG